MSVYLRALYFCCVCRAGCQRDGERSAACGDNLSLKIVSLKYLRVVAQNANASQPVSARRVWEFRQRPRRRSHRIATYASHPLVRIACNCLSVHGFCCWLHSTVVCGGNIARGFCVGACVRVCLPCVVREVYKVLGALFWCVCVCLPLLVANAISSIWAKPESLSGICRANTDWRA